MGEAPGTHAAARPPAHAAFMDQLQLLAHAACLPASTAPCWLCRAVLHPAAAHARHAMTVQVSYDGLGVEMVLECTGVFLTREKLAPYFAKGVKKVVVSAPVKDPEPVLNIVVGCNEVRDAHTCAGTWTVGACAPRPAPHRANVP